MIDETPAAYNITEGGRLLTVWNKTGKELFQLRSSPAEVRENVDYIEAEGCILAAEALFESVGML